EVLKKLDAAYFELLHLDRRFQFLIAMWPYPSSTFQQMVFSGTLQLVRLAKEKCTNGRNAIDTYVRDQRME
ncbi:MAG: hypothetical protein KDA58_16300, partial [Planctomycetaceae bacterium]|nr:hypothetical protein [Planctomycetaceae bacterium]